MGFRVFGRNRRFGVLLGMNTSSALTLPSANRLAWWDASQGIYEDTSLIDPCEDGDTVAGWSDRGPSGLHVTQGTAGDRPIYRASVAALKGKQGIEFVSNDFLGRTGLSGSVVASLSVFSIYIVFSTTSAGFGTLYSEGKSDNAVPYVSVNQNAAAITADLRDDASVRPTLSGGTTANNGSAHIYTLRRISATSWSLRLDGTQVATDTDNTGTTTINRLAIGCFGRASNTQFYVGHIGQVASYSADNYLTIEPLLAAHYGITLP